MELEKVLMPRPHAGPIKSVSGGEIQVTVFLKLPSLFYCAGSVENIKIYFLGNKGLETNSCCLEHRYMANHTLNLVL